MHTYRLYIVLLFGLLLSQQGADAQDVMGFQDFQLPSTKSAIIPDGAAFYAMAMTNQLEFYPRYALEAGVLVDGVVCTVGLTYLDKTLHSGDFVGYTFGAMAGVYQSRYTNVAVEASLNNLDHTIEYNPGRLFLASMDVVASHAITDKLTAHGRAGYLYYEGFGTKSIFQYAAALSYPLDVFLLQAEYKGYAPADRLLPDMFAVTAAFQVAFFYVQGGYIICFKRDDSYYISGLHPDGYTLHAGLVF